MEFVPKKELLESEGVTVSQGGSTALQKSPTRLDHRLHKQSKSVTTNSTAMESDEEKEREGERETAAFKTAPCPANWK